MSERIWREAHVEAIDPAAGLRGLDGYFFPENHFQISQPITISLRGVNVAKNIMQVRQFALKAPGDR
jgi:hypothetical protein